MCFAIIYNDYYRKYPGRYFLSTVYSMVYKEAIAAQDSCITEKVNKDKCPSKDGSSRFFPDGNIDFADRGIHIFFQLCYCHFEFFGKGVAGQEKITLIPI